jgi:hypothetical protein
MAACGPGNPCTCGPGNPCAGINECCGGLDNSLISTINKCGTSVHYCNYETQTDLCGPCNKSDCYDWYPSGFYRGSHKCQKQVNEWKDCKFTKGNCINGRRQIIINKQPNGGVACPTYEYEICNDCEFSAWTDCSNNNRTRKITKAETNGGLSCPDESSLIQTCNNCEVVSDWTACTVCLEKTDSRVSSGDCTNKQRTREIIPATNGGLDCPDSSSIIQTCSDCIVSDWTGPCINNKRIKRTIPPTNGGLSCQYLDPSSLIQTCNNCVVSWSPCINRTRTRKRTQSINGGTACTLEENALPETQICSDCVVSEWTACTNTNNVRFRTKQTIPPTNGGLSCPDESSLIQSCNDCIVSDWSNCIDNRKTKTTIPPKNGGISCPNESSLIKSCNNCEVSVWSQCSNNRRTRIITKTPTNGGSCDYILTEPCDECNEEWSKCDCNTKTITKNCNGIIQTKNCNNNCENKNIFNYIINFFNYIALIIMNFLKL